VVAVVVVAVSLVPQSIVSNGRNIIGKYEGQGQQWLCLSWYKNSHRRKRSLFVDSQGGMGVMHICDYLLISTCDYEKNKKAINAIKGICPDSCEPDIHHISERLARCIYGKQSNIENPMN
jgi:hypothetical protein